MSHTNQDIDDFDAALEKCRPRLAGLVSRRWNIITGEDLDDLLQETFLRSMRMRDRFESGSGDELFRWLSSIALSAAREFARSQKGQRLSGQPELAGSSMTGSRVERR